MKVYTKIVYDKDDNIIEEHSYNYKGPVSRANAAKLAAALKARMKASKIPENLTTYKTHKTVNVSRRSQKKVPIRPDPVTGTEYPGANIFEDDSEPTVEVQETHHDKSKSKTNLRPNVLHNFTSYNTIFTLSGISEEELKTHSFLRNPVHDIIARTGGIGGDAMVSSSQAEGELATEASTGDASDAERFYATETFHKEYDESIGILSRAHDVFIEKVEMISTASPNAERNLGNFTRMEFQIVEPFGVTLIEKIRAATKINRYNDYQDAPLLLTMEWKGWDEHGKNVNKGLLPRKIPIYIARLELDIAEAGAVYTIIAVPYTDLAYDDRFKFPRTNVPAAVDTIHQWIKDTEHTLNVIMMSNEVKEKKRSIGMEDTYEFQVHDDVVKFGREYKRQEESTTSSETVADIVKKEETETQREQIAAGEIKPIERNIIQKLWNFINPKVKRISGSATANIPLTKYFEDAIRSLEGYQELADNFWVSYLRKVTSLDESVLEDEDRLGKLITNDKYMNEIMKNSENQYVDWFKIKTSVETDTKRFDNITKMHPKKIIYQAIPYKIHILKFIQAGVSIKNVDWSKLVHKKYDYIYTGDNVDVQDLKLHYKVAYWQRNVRSDIKGVADKGVFTWVEKVKKNVFGQEQAPEPLKPLRQYPSTIRGVNSINVDASNRSQQFYDYLTNPEVDMIRIELDILGDPAYICQDMYTPIHSGRVKTADGGYKKFSDKFNSFNSDAYQPIIYVNYRIPDDIDINKGTMFTDGEKYRDENLFFNGLYQVNKIESKFDNGQFLQTLHCSRFNNQQGEGIDPVVEELSTGAISDMHNIVSSTSESAIRAADFAVSQAKSKLSNLKNKGVFTLSGYATQKALEYDLKKKIKKASKIYTDVGKGD